MASTGYYKICPKCFRKYGRHFDWCLDCSPKAKPDNTGRYPIDTYHTRWGNFTRRERVWLRFCCSKQLDLDKRLAICEKCRAKFKCFTQSDDEGLSSFGRIIPLQGIETSSNLVASTIGNAEDYFILC